MPGHIFIIGGDNLAHMLILKFFILNSFHEFRIVFHQCLQHFPEITGGDGSAFVVFFQNPNVDVVDPELGIKRLQPVLDVMNDAVSRYDGVVNKSQGDGIMALFGAPRPHEDHAVRGCLAALAMQDDVKRLDDADLQIRVGVHTGDVVVQAIEHARVRIKA